MTRMIIGAAVGALGLATALVATGSVTDASAQSARANSRTSASEVPAQSRPRARIRVAPLYPYGRVGPYRPYATDYPVPYQYDYPGPGYVRQCSSRLVTEARLSGPVITPRMRCWWQPGQ